MERYLKEFQSGLEKINLELTEKQMQQFVDYYHLLVETNKVMNLTSITEPLEVIQKHFLDSLAICRVHDMKSVGKMIDIGTGAGFPGIPLKILFPEVEVVLLDSLQKRIRFLDEVVRKLGLEKIIGIHGRSEDAARIFEYREQFDLCVSRAVANLSSLSELCLPFVKVGGTFISYKAGNCTEEVEHASHAINILGGNLREAKEFVIPDTDLARTFVIVDKIKNTAKKYPRKAGTPVKEPLG